MGLANRSNLMKTPITIWEMVEDVNPINSGWTKKEIFGQYVKKTTKTVSSTNEEVTSYAYFVIGEELLIKENEYKIEYNHTENILPDSLCFEVVSVKDAPTISEIKKGIRATEWIVYV